MAFQITWRNETSRMELGITKLGLHASVQLAANGKISLSNNYPSDKFFPRSMWADPKVPRAMGRTEWSDGLILVEGIVRFNILEEWLEIETIPD